MSHKKPFAAQISVCLFFPCATMAQGTITTYAGSDSIFVDAGQPATSAHLLGPNAVAVDGQGNLYIANSGLEMVLKVSATGIISIAAGNGLNAAGGDGSLATAASLLFPSSVAVDSSGNLYIADAYAGVIRKVNSSGIISTVGGGGNSGLGDGGPATQASLSLPTGVAVDKSGNLYIVDAGNGRVRMISASTGVISTFAGTGTNGYGGDGGQAVNAPLGGPRGVAVDSSGNVYIADTFNCLIREVTPNGVINTVAGTPHACGSGGDGGPATKATLSNPETLTVDSSGNLYIADTGNETIRRVSNGTITTIAGTAGKGGFAGDGGSAAAALFSTPSGVAVDSSGNIYVADTDNNRIRKVVQGGNVTTFAGTTTSIGDNGPSTKARLNRPTGAAVDSAGNLYIADNGENRIRKVTLSGTITTLAGNGQGGNAGNNGPASGAILNSPSGVAVDSAGNVYIADAGNALVHRVDATTGNISIFAGGGGASYSGPGTAGDGGPAVGAGLFYPSSVAVDGAGNVYITDFVASNNPTASFAIRRVTTDGKINTWAGGYPNLGFSGDGGSPIMAQFSANVTITAGSDGSLYIADAGNARIRKVNPAGTLITTIAGNGQGPSGDGGPAASAGLAFPQSVALDKAGNLYIGSPSTIRMVNSAGTISTYAGNGQVGFSGDGGPATAAGFGGVSGLATDSGGNLYIVDNGNNRVRQVQPAVAPVIGLSSTGVNVTNASGGAGFGENITITNMGQGTLNWAASATTTSGGSSWLSITPASGSVLAGQAGNTLMVNLVPTGLSPGDYYGQVQITSPSAASPVQMITVHYTIQTPGEAPPSVSRNGVVNNASFAPGYVAPGTMVSIFGSNFTDSTSTLLAQSLPLPTNLGGTSVTISGEPVPLFFVTAGQIGAILPFDLVVNTAVPIVVTRNNAVSLPQVVSMISSRPGVFTQTGDGTGVGLIVIAHSDGSQVLAGNGTAATAGDVLVIYCTGLGDVNPRAIAGDPAPVSPLAQAIDPVTVAISGVNVPVFFAGPTPNFAGLYQVNATVPAGIAPNSAAPLVVTQGGRPGATVTIPMK